MDLSKIALHWLEINFKSTFIWFIMIIPSSYELLLLENYFKNKIFFCYFYQYFTHKNDILIENVPKNFTKMIL